ncbi:MAG: ABC transporter substrate-binding protein [Xenophilus sp.]
MKAHLPLSRMLATAAVALAAISLGACDSSSSASGSAAPGAAIRISPVNSYSTLTLSKNVNLAHQLSDGTPIQWGAGFPAFAPALDALNADSIDVSTGGATNIFTALDSGAQFYVIGTEASHFSEGIVVSAKSGITSVADLKGKVIAVNKAGTGEYFADKALDSAGLKPSDATLKYLSPADGLAAFEAGSVDAIAAWDQYFITAQQVPGARVITTGEDLHSTNVLFTFVAKKFADAHPDAVKSLIKDLQATSTEARKNPKLVTDLYTSLGAGPNITNQVAQWPTLDFTPVNDDTIKLLQEHEQFLAKAGIIPNAGVDIHQWIVKP